MTRFSKQSPMRRWVKGVSRVTVCVAMGMACSLQQASALTHYVTVKAIILDGPRCSIVGNAAGRIDVPFGDTLRTDMIDGVNYEKPIPFSLSCSGSPSTLRFKFSGNTGATFDPNVLATSFPDLGVRLLKPDGSALNLNDEFAVTVIGAPAFKAVPVQRPGATLPTGSFSASATLTMEVQ